jgi:hypothetical protein
MKLVLNTFGSAGFNIFLYLAMTDRAWLSNMSR